MPEVFPMTATSVTFSIRTAVRKVMPYMMEMREYFHARPETSGNEFDTCKTIFRELSLLGAEDIRIIAGTGVNCPNSWIASRSYRIITRQNRCRRLG